MLHVERLYTGHALHHKRWATRASGALAKPALCVLGSFELPPILVLGAHLCKASTGVCFNSLKRTPTVVQAASPARAAMGWDRVAVPTHTS